MKGTPSFWVTQPVEICRLETIRINIVSVENAIVKSLLMAVITQGQPHKDDLFGKTTRKKTIDSIL